MTDEDKLVKACRRSDTPIWVDLILIGIVLAVGSWLIYLILSEPL